MGVVALIGEPTHIMVVQPLGSPQIPIPFGSESAALEAVEAAIDTGVVRVSPGKPGERYLFIQTGPGTVYMVMTVADMNKQIAAQRFAMGNGAPQIQRG